MKRWIASAAALLLVLAVTVPAVGAEERDSSPAFAWSLDLQEIVNWIATLWYDHAAPTSPDSDVSDGEQPRAFIEGVGPYIVPVGFASTDPDPDAITETDDETSGDS